MEACGGGGGGAWWLGEDGLVALAIFGIVGTTDVRGERHMAELLQLHEEIGGWRETEEALAELSVLNYFGLERCGVVGGGECQLVADLDFLAGADEGFPFPFAGLLGEEDFDFSGFGVGFASQKTGGDDAAIVEDEDVAFAEEVGEIAELAVAVFSGGAIELEHSCAGAFGKGLLGDEFFGEIEVEIGDEHWSILLWGGGGWASVQPQVPPLRSG